MRVNRGYKASQNIPELFKEIIRHDAIRPKMPLRHSEIIEHKLWFEYYAKMEPWLKRQQELIAAAERALAWNHNKGNTA